MTIQGVAGSFPFQESNAGHGAYKFVFAENNFNQLGNPGNGNPVRLPGLVRTVSLGNQPTVMERWAIVGWSIRLALVTLYQTQGNGGSFAANPFYANYGDLWAGIFTDMPVAQSSGGFGDLSPSQGLVQLPGGAFFPPDLSTFTRVWTQDDGIIAMESFGGASFPVPPPSGTYFQTATTYMLPTPIDVRNSSQLRMGLILQPSIMSGFHAFVCVSAAYSVLYDKATRDQA